MTRLPNFSPQSQCSLVWLTKEVAKPGADNCFTYVERASELAQHGLAEARRSVLQL
jgi:hypothetical protein